MIETYTAPVVTAKIIVVQKHTNKAVLLLTQAVFWGLLVGAVGVNRVWFGGSLLIELIATVLTIAMAIKIFHRAVGIEVAMTPTELRSWLAIGAPKNVQAWRKGLYTVRDEARS